MLIPLCITALFVGLFIGRVIVHRAGLAPRRQERKGRASRPSRLCAINPRLITRQV